MFSFGASQNNNNNNVNNNNQQQQQQQQQQSSFSGFQVPQTQPDAGQLTLERLTRVSDLPNDAQNLIEQLYQHILQQISISDQFALNEEGLGETVDSIETDVAEIQRRCASTNAALRNDQSSLESLRDQVHADAENIRISTIFMDGIRSGSLNTRGSPDHILKYFYDTATHIDADLNIYNKLVSAIEAHILHASGQRSRQDAATLLETLKAQHEAFLRLSSKVATVHDRVLCTL